MKLSKIKKILTLLEGVYNYNILHHFKSLPPTEMQINVTYRCNSRCIMCNIWKMNPKNELTISEWRKIMKDPIFSTIEHLTLAGGEPICHKDLVNLVRLFIKSMPKLQHLSLITNGFLSQLTVARVKSLATLLQTMGITLSVMVSLDGVGRIHEMMRQTPGVFKKVSSTIMFLKSLSQKYNFFLSVGCVVCRKNLYHVAKLKTWCKKNKISFNLQLVGFHKTYIQNLDQKEELDFRKRDKKYLFDIFQNLVSQPSWRNTTSYYWNDTLNMYKKNAVRTTPCPFTLDAFALDSFGDVYYCLSARKIGNCRRGKTVSEIYYDPKNLFFRQRLLKNSCLHCNSACFIRSAIRKDLKKFIWFYLTGTQWPL